MTEPDAGSDTTASHDRRAPTATRYVVNGQKICISRVQHSDLMLLLARTTPLRRGQAQDRRPLASSWSTCARRGDGADRQRPIATMINHDTNEVVHRRPARCRRAPDRRGGQGFRHILDGLNAERILIAAECVGDGRWFVERAATVRRERVVFGRPIGANQGVQFPLARAHVASRRPT